MRFELISKQNPLFCNVCLETKWTHCFICQEDHPTEKNKKPTDWAKQQFWKVYKFRTLPDIKVYNNDFDLNCFGRMGYYTREDFLDLELHWHKTCFKTVAKVMHLNRFFKKLQNKLGIRKKDTCEFSSEKIQQMFEEAERNERTSALSLDDLDPEVRNYLQTVEDKTAGGTSDQGLDQSSEMSTINTTER